MKKSEKSFQFFLAIDMKNAEKKFHLAKIFFSSQITINRLACDLANLNSIIGSIYVKSI